jgi:hypothetical protein
MRTFILLILTPVFLKVSLPAFASASASDARLVYAVREEEFIARDIRPKTNTIQYDLPYGGWGIIHVSPKTWYIKDNEEATFEDLRVGQRLHVWMIPRGSQAVIVEILPPKPGQDGKR